MRIIPLKPVIAVLLGGSLLGPWFSPAAADDLARGFTEAFAKIGPHWEESPADLKPTADIAFCEGINRFFLHTWSRSVIRASRELSPMRRRGENTGRWTVGRRSRRIGDRTALRQRTRVLGKTAA